MKKLILILFFLVLLIFLVSCQSAHLDKSLMVLNPRSQIDVASYGLTNTSRDASPPYSPGHIILDSASEKQLKFTVWIPIEDWFLHRVVEVADGEEDLVSSRWVTTTNKRYNLSMKPDPGFTFIPGKPYRLYIGKVILHKNSNQPDYFFWYYKFDFTFPGQGNGPPF